MKNAFCYQVIFIYHASMDKYFLISKCSDIKMVIMNNTDVQINIYILSSKLPVTKCHCLLLSSSQVYLSNDQQLFAIMLTVLPCYLFSMSFMFWWNLSPVVNSVPGLLPHVVVSDKSNVSEVHAASSSGSTLKVEMCTSEISASSPTTM